MTTNTRKLVRIVTALRGRRIAVAGDFMLDRYVWGAATRLSPESPVPVVDFMNDSQVLGGAGNVAANLAALGATVLPFGVIGEDEPGRAIRECLAAAANEFLTAVRAVQSTTCYFMLFSLPSFTYAIDEAI